MRKVAVQTTGEHLCPGLKAFANICKAAHMAKITRILSATSRCFLVGIANIAKEKNYNVTKGKKARKDCKYSKIARILSTTSNCSVARIAIIAEVANLASENTKI